MAKQNETTLLEWAVLAAVGWAVMKSFAGAPQAAMPAHRDAAPMPDDMRPAPDARQLQSGDTTRTDAEYWRDPTTYDYDKPY